MNIISNIKDSHINIIRGLSNKSDEIHIFSPFCYQDFDDFFEIIHHNKIKNITLTTTLVSDGLAYKVNSLISFMNCLKNRKTRWEINIDNKLHGKLYFFQKNNKFLGAILSSANITDNGMKYNHEWGYLLTDKKEIKILFDQANSCIIVKALSETKIYTLYNAVNEYLRNNPIRKDKNNKSFKKIINNTIVYCSPNLTSQQ